MFGKKSPAPTGRRMSTPLGKTRRSGPRSNLAARILVGFYFVWTLGTLGLGLTWSLSRIFFDSTRDGSSALAGILALAGTIMASSLLAYLTFRFSKIVSAGQVHSIRRVAGATGGAGLFLLIGLSVAQSGAVLSSLTLFLPAVFFLALTLVCLATYSTYRSA